MGEILRPSPTPTRNNLRNISSLNDLFSHGNALKLCYSVILIKNVNFYQSSPAGESESSELEVTSPLMRESLVEMSDKDNKMEYKTKEVGKFY